MFSTVGVQTSFVLTLVAGTSILGGDLFLTFTVKPHKGANLFLLSAQSALAGKVLCISPDLSVALLASAFMMIFDICYSCFQIFSESKDEIAIVLFGTEETNNRLADDGDGYQNIVELRTLCNASYDLLEDVQKIQPGSEETDCIL